MDLNVFLVPFQFTLAKVFLLQTVLIFIALEKVMTSIIGDYSIIGGELVLSPGTRTGTHCSFGTGTIIVAGGFVSAMDVSCHMDVL